MWVSIGDMFYNCTYGKHEKVYMPLYIRHPTRHLNSIDNSRFVINKEDYFNVFRFSRVIL